jgi:hypothetical protein
MNHTVSAWPSGDGGGDQFRWAKSFAGSNPAVDNPRDLSEYVLKCCALVLYFECLVLHLYPTIMLPLPWVFFCGYISVQNQ